MKKEFLKLIIRLILVIIITIILHMAESFTYEENTNLLVWAFIASAIVRIIELENYVYKKEKEINENNARSSF